VGKAATATEPEIAVVGAGIVGLSAALALRERGAAVTVFERGVPGAAQSGGESRIFRHVHEDPRLIRLAREARTRWREWEASFGRELLSSDGVVAIGPTVERRLAALEADGEVRARLIDGAELAERLPVIAHHEGPALLDEDGGAIRTRAAIHALTRALEPALVIDEVLSVLPTARDTVVLRAAGRAREYARVLVCAGRGTVALARGAGLSLPVRHSAHVRLTYPVRGEPPRRLACLLDGGSEVDELGAYADPYPGNAAYAVGIVQTPAGEDGSLIDPSDLDRATERTGAYVAKRLPGLDPRPLESRHCWVTELPWSADGFALWRAGGLLVFAGNHLFKHAPALGHALAAATLSDGVPAALAPSSRLGAELTAARTA
jgi:sarcosine oxidase